ncbi:MAG TPA: CPBP family glutamic-type intramembrane protease [Caulobacterales bacterium]|nr:CPBP family glutamic-type intramembrane protease [Caulobacterales bacterium]
MAPAELPNARAALRRRRETGSLGWSGPALMLFARSGFAVAANAGVAAALLLQGSATPWRDAARWFPVYATLIDAGCLALLWMLMRREGARLFDLLSFDRRRVGRDLLLALLLIAPSLVFILGGIGVASRLIYGSGEPHAIFAPLPLPAALYAGLVFPLIWGFTEQMTYNGYLAARIQVVSGSTAVAVALVAFSWSFQHVVMPIRFDADYALYRMISPIPFSVFIVLVYLRLRRLAPLAIAHWLMDGASVFLDTVWPALH